jgi:hypothetical protein
MGPQWQHNLNLAAQNILASQYGPWGAPTGQYGPFQTSAVAAHSAPAFVPGAVPVTVQADTRTVAAHSAPAIVSGAVPATAQAEIKVPSFRSVTAQAMGTQTPAMSTQNPVYRMQTTQVQVPPIAPLNGMQTLDHYYNNDGNQDVHVATVDAPPAQNDYMEYGDPTNHNMSNKRPQGGYNYNANYRDAQFNNDNCSVSGAKKRTRSNSKSQVLIKSKNYSGQDQAFNLEDFTEYLEQQKRYYDWSDEEYVEHALICLTGAALNCVSENEEPVTTWTQLRKLLHDTLEPDGSEVKYLHQLKTLYLKKDESLSSYTDKIKRIGKLAYPGIQLVPREKMLIQVFTDGLRNPDVTKAIAFQQVRNLNHALRIAASDPNPINHPSGETPENIKTSYIITWSTE